MRGELTRAIGRSRGERTTKVHALTDRICRPLGFLLTGSQVADRTAADALLDKMPPAVILNGDKGYDSDVLRRKIESKGAAPNIPPKANRRWKNCFSPTCIATGRHRAHVRRPRGFLENRNSIQPPRSQLSRRRLSRRYPLLLVVSPDPSVVQESTAGEIEARQMHPGLVSSDSSRW